MENHFVSANFCIINGVSIPVLGYIKLQNCISPFSSAVSIVQSEITAVKFTLYEERVAWDTAKSRCEAAGQRLAVLDTADKLAALKEQMWGQIFYNCFGKKYWYCNNMIKDYFVRKSGPHGKAPQYSLQHQKPLSNGCGGIMPCPCTDWISIQAVFYKHMHISPHSRITNQNPLWDKRLFPANPSLVQQPEYKLIILLTPLQPRLLNIGSIRIYILMTGVVLNETNEDVRMYTWRIYSSRDLDTLLHKLKMMNIGKVQVYIHSQQRIEKCENCS